VVHPQQPDRRILTRSFAPCCIHKDVVRGCVISSLPAQFWGCTKRRAGLSWGGLYGTIEAGQKGHAPKARRRTESKTAWGLTMHLCTSYVGGRGCC
jgi:hypothetical protein